MRNLKKALTKLGLQLAPLRALTGGGLEALEAEGDGGVGDGVGGLAPLVDEDAGEVADHAEHGVGEDVGVGVADAALRRWPP